jgi:hypothetical protein
MDCSLNAKNWLATSSFFEPFVPSSHQNVRESLKLLCLLGEITRTSFQAIPVLTPEPNPKPAPASVPTPALSPAKLKDATLIEALMKLNEARTSFNRTTGPYSIILRPKPL